MSKHDDRLRKQRTIDWFKLYTAAEGPKRPAKEDLQLYLQSFGMEPIEKVVEEH